MKILTILGTRPEIIRLSLIIKKLDELCEHYVLHTGQNYDPNLGDIFFDEMGIRRPDRVLDNVNNSQGTQIGIILDGTDEVLSEFKPDKVLILGDTNSGLASIVCKRKGIPVYHMEAGNRCYDDRLPEEINRQLIDHLSTYNLPYTENSKQNLLSEGFHKNYVFKTGNPIYEVLNHYWQHIKNSKILEKLELKKQNFVLVTAHRTENVDDKESLHSIVGAINLMSRQYPVVVSLHPRTKDKLKDTKLKFFKNVILSAPFGFFDFVKLESEAKLVISDSGTVQEECCILKVPSITIRNSTERQETVECGSNILSGTDTEQIMRVFNVLVKRAYDWNPPEDYVVNNVSDTVINIILGR